MKKILKSTEPELLANYKRTNPNNNWEQFRNSVARKRQVKTAIIDQQGGLCAYCEIDLRSALPGNNEEDDFRVEHFHPKSDNATTHNWNLDWNNLIGCCHGGSQSNIVNASNRFTSPDTSCDIPKGSNNWDDMILNPLHLPASPALFSFSRSSGSMFVNLEHCQAANVNVVKAQQSIDLLRLNSGRLLDFRIKILQRLEVQLRKKIEDGMSLDEARTDLAQRLLRKNSNGCWPKFFSTIRHYLGDAAERQLESIHYIG